MNIIKTRIENMIQKLETITTNVKQFPRTSLTKGQIAWLDYSISYLEDALQGIKEMLKET